jgi:hypothetical protein
MLSGLFVVPSVLKPAFWDVWTVPSVRLIMANASIPQTNTGHNIEQVVGDVVLVYLCNTTLTCLVGYVD